MGRRNARDMGVAFAEFGLSLELLAEHCGVAPEWAGAARRAGTRELAEMAWGYTHPVYGYSYPDEEEEQQRESYRPWINMVRFARAANSYMTTPFRSRTEYDVGPQVVITQFEETGGPESGPQLSCWLEVVEREASVA
jgi:hypothetical protein